MFVLRLKCESSPSLVLLDLLTERDAEHLVGEARGDAEEGRADPDEGDHDLLLRRRAVLHRPHRLPRERRGHVVIDGGGHLRARLPDTTLTLLRFLASHIGVGQT